jgi:hypothetical protein
MRKGRDEKAFPTLDHLNNVMAIFQCLDLVKHRRRRVTRLIKIGNIKACSALSNKVWRINLYQQPTPLLSRQREDKTTAHKYQKKTPMYSFPARSMDHLYLKSCVSDATHTPAATHMTHILHFILWSMAHPVFIEREKNVTCIGWELILCAYLYRKPHKFDACASMVIQFAHEIIQGAVIIWIIQHCDECIMCVLVNSSVELWNNIHQDHLLQKAKLITKKYRLKILHHSYLNITFE